MKKSLLILVAAAAVWTGCSKTETIDQPQGMAIGFTNAYIGNPVESKAVDTINRENITEFIVYGGYNDNDMTHVFNGVSVTGSAKTDEWSYTTTRYWVAGKTYKFAAYAPSGISGMVETDFDNGALNFTNYVSDPSNQFDLIYATEGKKTAADITSDPGKIQFEFSHLLSMIKFTFNSGFGNDITVTVDNLNVSGMIFKGSYFGNTQKWTLGSETVSTEAAFTEMASKVAVNQSSGNTSASSVDFAVLPQTIVGQEAGTGTKVTISFDIRVQDNENNYIIGSAGAGETVTATLPAYEWTAGNRYNYTVTIKGENVNLFPIEFGTPDVNGITNDVNFPGSDEVILPTN